LGGRLLDAPGGVYLQQNMRSQKRKISDFFRKKYAIFREKHATLRVLEKNRVFFAKKSRFFRENAPN